MLTILSDVLTRMGEGQIEVDQDQDELPGGTPSTVFRLRVKHSAGTELTEGGAARH